MEKNKTLQIRLSEKDYQKVKFAFKNDNLSAVVRDFLLSKANEKILNDGGDMSLQEDIELQKFVSFLSHPEVQKSLFNLFKNTKEV